MPNKILLFRFHIRHSANKYSWNLKLAGFRSTVNSRNPQCWEKWKGLNKRNKKKKIENLLGKCFNNRIYEICKRFNGVLGKNLKSIINIKIHNLSITMDFAIASQSSSTWNYKKNLEHAFVSRKQEITMSK